MTEKFYKAKPGTFPEKGELKIDYECILSDDRIRKFYCEVEINILRYLRDKAEKEYNTLIRLQDAERLILDKVSGYKATDFASSHEHIKVREQVLDCLAKIRKLRTVDAEPVRHGRWIVDIKRLKASCSECGKILQFSDEMQISLLRDEERFCYYCGAKMDGGNEE